MEDSLKLRRMSTQVGQIAHVNLRNHHPILKWLFLLSFLVVIGIGNNKLSDKFNDNKSRHLSSPHIDGQHTVFVLDRSGSMCGSPLKDVENAYQEFIKERKTVDHSNKDKVSVIQFDHGAEKLLSKIDISTEPLGLECGGSTSYSEGFKLALKTLKEGETMATQPVLVFMSDGQPTESFYDTQKSVDELKAWADRWNKANSARPLEVFTIHFGNAGGEATLNDIADKLRGTYHKAVDGIALSKTFKAVANWSSYDDLSVSFLSSLLNLRVEVTFPLICAILLFSAFIIFLKLFAEYIITLIVLTLPVVVGFGASAFVFQVPNSLWDDQVKIGVVAVILIITAIISYKLYQKVKVSTASLRLGTTVLATFWTIIPFQVLTLIAWAIWAKYVTFLLFDAGSDDIYYSIQYNFISLNQSSDQLFLDPWNYSLNTIGGLVMSPNCFLTLQLTVVTGFLFAMNTFVVSRAAAAVYFGFTAKYPNGGLDLYIATITSASGVCIFSGIVRAFISSLDQSFKTFEYLAKICFSMGIVVAICILIPIYFIYLLVTGADTKDFEAVGKKVALFLLGFSVLFYIVVPLLRKWLKQLLDYANYLSVVIAGVTGNSYIDSVKECMIQVFDSNSGSAIALSTVTMSRINTVASIVLPTFSIAVSTYMAQKMGYIEYNDLSVIVTGSTVAVMFITLALDALYAAVMACLLCILIQNSADVKVIPGTPESKRRKSQFELEAQALIGNAPASVKRVDSRNLSTDSATKRKVSRSPSKGRR